MKDKTQRARFDAGEIDAKGQPLFRSVKPDFRRAAEDAGAGAGAGAAKQGWQAAQRTDEVKARNADVFSLSFSAGWKRGARRDERRKAACEWSIFTLSFEEAARGTRKLLTLATGGKVVVTVPPAVEDGQVLRLKGANGGGGGGGGGKGGNVRVRLSVAPHAELTRDGLDLKLELPVTLGEAVLGGKVRVHTLDGAVVLTVPPGSNSGTVLKLAAKASRRGARAATFS